MVSKYNELIHVYAYTNLIPNFKYDIAKFPVEKNFMSFTLARVQSNTSHKFLGYRIRSGTPVEICATMVTYQISMNYSSSLR